MSNEPDPLERGLEAAYGQRSTLDVLAEKTGLDTRISVTPDTSGPMLKPLRPGDGGLPDGGGKYQLQGEIARGGVGVVLKGYDTHLGRDVAVKLLHENHVADSDLVQRFVEEAQIGGQLQHPGIVPVYDLGLRGDRPFFSMKLVKGRTLAALLEEGRGRRALLSIFEQICHTMAYAHARGVIHRDLKPANVMVGAFGEVQVVDWGMGKVLGAKEPSGEPRPDLSVINTVRSDRTGSQSIVGSVMGTPAYMPPEQARGDVERMDERSDVFAMGAVLCEILTGAPPYVGEQRIQMAAQADLAACWERLDACDAADELKTLVRTCLAPAPDGRPRDAGELADRIGRHLTSVEERAKEAQVEAAEQRAQAHGAKRAQRLTAVLAVSVLFLLAVGVGGWSWLERERTRREEDAGRVVRVALDDARVEFGRGDWDVALASAERANALARSDDVSEELRRSVADHLERVRERREQAAARAERVAQEERDLAKLEAIPIPPESALSPISEEDARRRDAAYREMLGAPETLDLAVKNQPERWAAVLDDWAFADYVLKGTARGRLVTIARAIDPDPQRDEIRDLLVEGWPVTADLLRLADEIENPPPMTALTLAALLAASWEHGRATDLLRATAERYPDHYLVALRLSDNAGMAGRPKDQLRFASIASALRPDSKSASFLQGRALNDLGRYSEAEAAFRRAIELDPEYAAALHNLGHALEWLERYEDALAAIAEAARLNPDDLGTRRCLGAAFHRVGLHTEGRRERAEWRRTRQRGLERQLAEAESAVAEERSLHTLNSLGNAFRALGRHEDALAAYQEASRVDPGNPWAWTNIGATYAALKQFDEAVANTLHALRLDASNAIAHYNLADSRRSQRRPEVVLAHLRDACAAEPGNAEWPRAVGQQLLAMGRVDEALEAHRRALELSPKSHFDFQEVARILWQKGERDEAIARFREGVERAPRRAGSWANLARHLFLFGEPAEALRVGHEGAVLVPDTVIWGTIGWIHFQRREMDEAVKAWRKALEIDPEESDINLNVAAWLRRQGRTTEAEPYFRAAIRHVPENGMLRYNLGNRLGDLGRREDAIAMYRSALDLAPGLAEAWCNLAGILHRQGLYRDALRHLEKGFAIGSKNPIWPEAARMAKWMESLRPLAETEPRLERVLALEIEPRDDPEVESAARMGVRRKEFAAVVALARAAIPQGFTGARYQGARAAVKLAIDDVERRDELHALALNWLRDRLASRLGVRRLRTWLTDSALSSVRDGEVQAEWAMLWREVREDPERARRVLALQEEPRNVGEAYRAVELGYDGKQYADAIACVRELESRFPELRYYGACAAALAGDRELAVQWLRAELAAGGKTKKQLQWWLEDADLASVRDGEIPAEFEAFWRDVRAALEVAK